jgi:hypothetical protein
MTAADWQPVIQAIIAGIALVMTTLIGIYVPKAIAAFEKRTGVAVNDQERAAVMNAVTTAAGILQSKLDQGVLKIGDITPTSRAVVLEAHDALERVPTSAANQGTTPAAAAAMIAARVDTSPKPAVVVVPTPPVSP